MPASTANVSVNLILQTIGFFHCDDWIFTSIVLDWDVDAVAAAVECAMYALGLATVRTARNMRNIFRYLNSAEL